jgi:cellulose synthase (UDP-forming)
MTIDPSSEVHFRRVSNHYLVDVLDDLKKRQLKLLIWLWFLTVVSFCMWWFQPWHFTDLIRFSFNSLILFWGLILPGYYFFFLSRMKRTNPALTIPSDWRIAMIVTRAPSEPFSLVKTMLLAMKRQTVPHDTWLADEDPTPEILNWCRKNQVFVSSRKGAPGYHRDTWPRRKKCKEGNLAYFYDHWGYDNYDFVSQMDADHIPNPDYLENIIRPFNDPAVGYVSAPSICDSNAKDSWIARGRLYLESHIHGSLQAGYNGGGWTPMCIGSHYAVRTVALKESGGLGPDLAEDHSTTLLLAAHGWKGIHAIDAEAHGEGPATFNDGLVQEFQWARSLVMIFLELTPKYLGRMPLQLKFQFLFGQLWYFLFSGMMMLSYALPVLSVFLTISFARVSYLQFIAFSLLPIASSVLVIFWVKAQRLLRPMDAKIVNWEVCLFQLARWPWVLWAVIDAIRCSVSRSALEWKVTPKTKTDNASIPLHWFVPYILLIFASLVITTLWTKTPETYGYYYLSLFNGATYILLGLVVLILQRRETSH